MRVAHLIMAYKGPLQLERLIKRLSHPQFDIYIHLDKKISIESFNNLRNLDRVRFIQNRVVCNWGGFSFVRAITLSVKEILEQNERYEFVNLLSAQDYPIKPIDHFYKYLKANTGKSFISFDKSNDSDWWKHAVTRYELYHFTDINIRGRYFIQRLLNRFMPKRKFPRPYKLYGSSISSWWTISSECAQYIVNYLEQNPDLIRFMRFTWAADEFLYATIIMNSSFKDSVINNNLRYIEWEDGKPNPKVFETKDIDLLKNSTKYFARKFDISIDMKVLDRLDQLIKIDLSK